MLCHMTNHQPMMAQYPLLALLLVLMLTSKPMNCMCPSQCDCSNKTVHCQGKDETKFGGKLNKRLKEIGNCKIKRLSVVKVMMKVLMELRVVRIMLVGMVLRLID